MSGPAPASGAGVAEPPPAPRSRLAQTAVLCRRYAALIAADRGLLVTLVVLPLVLGLLTRFTVPRLGLRGPDNPGAATVLLLLAIGVQLALTAAFALAAWWRLIQVSPGRTRRR